LFFSSFRPPSLPPLFPYTTLFRSLRSRFGPGVDPVLTVLAAGRAADLMPLGIVAGIVYATPADNVAAAVRFDERIGAAGLDPGSDRKSTRLNSSHSQISYAVFCLK